ncbi:MAG TPA: ABC transporter permease subunit [Paenirhodobacter sp.]
MKTSRIGRPVVVFILTCLVIAALWQGSIWFFKIPGYLMPRPLDVLTEGLGGAHAVLLARSGYTLLSALLGLGLSTLFAILVAVVFVIKPKVRQYSMPLVIALRSAPVAAVAPLIMLMLGRGIGTGVVVVTIVSFFPMLVNLSRGLQSPQSNALELMHVLNASKWQQLRFVRIPTALPFFFTGLRISVISAILGEMLSEWITGSRGLGLLILDAGSMREINLLWGAVIVSIMMALVLFWLTSAAERWASAFGSKLDGDAR